MAEGNTIPAVTAYLIIQLFPEVMSIFIKKTQKHLKSYLLTDMSEKVSGG